ncbi:pyruvate ferredoxin oxidoreductase [Eubacterium sp.]|uniref:pyruvate ferredoxin oxidoreductase n=1 Tax=Eubacterium sp. TaxID=142586 RepID=UPI00399C2497
MPKRVLMSGNEAVATALRQINPDVFPMFPITPSTEIPQYFSNYVSNGLVDTEFITVESEHSSMSAALGAAAAGARAVTATSSAGLAFMWEVLGVAASSRMPIALAAVARALTGPLNINCDHSDTMGARDSGWIQLYAEDNQEAYDNMVMAYNIAEHPDVMLPIMICQDGFITSHAVMNMQLLDDLTVKEFVGERQPVDYLLNPDETFAVGPYAVSDYYMESRKAQAHAMENAKKVILDVAKKFEKISGRKYGLIEEYKMHDAEYAVVIIGSAAGTTKDAIDRMRANGDKVGLIKVRSFRPFPGEEIAVSLKKCKAVAVMDRSEAFSTNGGPLGAETMQAMYTGKCDALAIDIMYGIGGRDVRVEDMINVYETLKDIAKTGETGPTYRYMGLRDKEAK